VSRARGAAAAALLCAWSGLNAATPALIDAPHPYYYDELYLPQLTSGPSAVSWSPDSQELVYSMGGWLWRQRTDGTQARQLTTGAQYAYQPDWSPDGRRVVYVCTRGRALELCLLDLASARAVQLTHGGAVNLEPRWSPDGQRLAFVSTMSQRHFHVFIAELQGESLGEPRQLVAENRSPLPRYYYSAFDHEINPTWTRDGQALLFVSNRGRIHGSGGFWRMPAQPGAPAAELRYEETNWGARPDYSPDGQRIVYSSYLGRGGLQLWLMPAQGGEPFALTYGDWDETGARWSPDGRQIAFISNRNGGLQLRLLQIPGGSSRQLEVTQRLWLQPMGTLHLVVRDAHGKPTPARVSVRDVAGRAYAPADAWMHHAEFDRNEYPFDARYFHTAGDDLIALPPGAARVEVMKGLARLPQQPHVAVRAGQTTEVAVQLPEAAWRTPGGERWVSADVHVHMNYGGHYRNTPAHLLLQAQAEDLDIVENLIVNKEQRIPDIAYSGHGVDAASTASNLVVHGQEFHTSYWGHLGILGPHGGVLLPGYAGYPNTAAASLYPSNAEVADMAHAQGALVGYVHPFEEPPQPLSHPAHTDADELPVDVALGKVDYMEIVSFADHQATASVWYRLLNLGFRIPAAGGTDAMADYATLRGPVGLNRVYAAVGDGPLDSAAWLAALRAGKSFATNGPLLNFTLGGQSIGATVQLPGATVLPFVAQVRSIVPLAHVQLVCNGEVVRELPLNRARIALDVTGSVSMPRSGWCVLRAFNTQAQYPVLDNFVYGTTSPVYVSVAGEPQRSPQDARYFRAWIEHLYATTAAYPDWNSAAEKAAVLKRLQEAAAVYERLQ
jgi:TolB protein